MKKFKKNNSVVMYIIAVMSFMIISACVFGITSKMTKSVIRASEKSVEIPTDIPVEEVIFSITPTNKPKAENVTPTETVAATENPTEAPKKEFSPIMPIYGEITVPFSTDKLVKSNTLKEWRTHSGIDISAYENTAVYAIEDGIVETSYLDKQMGYTVMIRHTDGFISIYQSLDSAKLLKGFSVNKGDVIGNISSTAAIEAADPVHLHFELIKDNEKVNPTEYIKYEKKE